MFAPEKKQIKYPGIMYSPSHCWFSQKGQIISNGVGPNHWETCVWSVKVESTKARRLV